MKKLAVGLLLAALALLPALAFAETRCSGSPCVDSSGGFTSPVTTNPVDASGVWSWPSAGSANAVQLGETAGAITFEVTGSDAHETRLNATQAAGDTTFTIPGSLANAGTYTLVANQLPMGAYGTGFFITGDSTTNSYVLMSILGVGLYKDAQLIWTSDAGTISGGGVLTNKDAGIARLGAARIKITDGASGSGGLQASQIVSVQPTTYTTTVNDSFTLFTNRGDTDGATITLMNDPSVGINHDIAVVENITLTVQPSAGETLYGAAGATCSTLASDTIGSVMHVAAAVGGSGGIWVTQLNGVWVCTP